MKISYISALTHALTTGETATWIIEEGVSHGEVVKLAPYTTRAFEVTKDGRREMKTRELNARF